jgi:hypothetical protein
VEYAIGPGLRDDGPDFLFIEKVSPVEDNPAGYAAQVIQRLFRESDARHIVTKLEEVLGQMVAGESGNARDQGFHKRPRQ